MIKLFSVKVRRGENRGKPRVRVRAPLLGGALVLVVVH